ncbi:universal stress protein [Algibacter miyuki]|uniref:Universal stress protein n=1 Tax=Algibacter miyuki TaxID=1306933 RepID=A0ABV5H227_9FLAO|nr:universal stress protein [Algibacter miyuki]MDN3666552.1 universal stress protein [Algibacter miyuki]
MKRIIVPIDFSEQSEYALKTAARLAKKHDAEILVLHMLEIDNLALTASASRLGEQTVYFLKIAEQRFEKFLNKPYLKDVKITPIIKHFKVFSEVNDVAKEREADIIIMGSHGTSGVQEMFIGSNTEKVVRNSEIPVLVVKNNIPDINFEVIVLACDFSKESMAPYINTVKMFEKIVSKIYVVHVNLPNEKFRSSVELEKRAVDFFNKADGHLKRMEDVHYVADYTVDEGILSFSNKYGADLIVMPTHGRKGLAHFFQGSVSEDVVNHSTLPVLTLKI